MGAKAPDQLNLRRPTVKCDVCGRKFLNTQALKSHHMFLHAKSESAKRLQFKKNVDAKQMKKKLVPVSMLKRVVPAQAPKQKSKTDGKEKTAEIPGKQTVAAKKAEFECPICALKFSVYFTAFRHIQKNHCVDSTGAKVPSNSPNLVKPVRLEICGTCSKHIRSTEPHSCTKPQANKDLYLCFGCDQTFNGIIMYQHHVKGLHADGAQNYFFPSRDEFAAWKKDLEKQISLNFVKLNKQKSKEIYHCSHQQDLTAAKTHLCPSILTVREYTKGFHVCYYKEHHGHTATHKDLDKFKHYCISLYVKENEELKMDAEDNNDLYLQFKKMITCIVYDAAKIDVNALKELVGKALEMTSILKNFDGDERNAPLISKCLTDAQISRTLETLKPNQSKRKPSPPPKEAKKVEVKRIKKDSVEDTPENGVNSKASRSSPVMNKSASVRTYSKRKEHIPEKKTEESAPTTPVQIQSPSSFNDSYKNFVDQNFKCLSDTSTPKAKSNVKKKEVVKTKIGQFKVKPSTPSPKDSSLQDSSLKEVKQVPDSPKKWIVKPDIQYEVKEQEDDCNILILKI